MPPVPPPVVSPHPTGQWLTAADGPRWWFDSGSIALDFAYTGALGDGPAEEQAAELLRDESDLAAWLGGRFTDSDGIVHGRHLTDARMLRASIARIALAAASAAPFDAGDVDAVNLFAATPDIPPSLDGGSRRAGRQTTSTGQALSTLARDAVTAFGPVAIARVRVCAADDCRLLFVDTSRAGSRRWCSMQRCGNRAKVRAFRARASAS